MEAYTFTNACGVPVMGHGIINIKPRGRTGNTGHPEANSEGSPLTERSPITPPSLLDKRLQLSWLPPPHFFM